MASITSPKLSYKLTVDTFEPPSTILKINYNSNTKRLSNVHEHEAVGVCSHVFLFSWSFDSHRYTIYIFLCLFPVALVLHLAKIFSLSRDFRSLQQSQNSD